MTIPNPNQLIENLSRHVDGPVQTMMRRSDWNSLSATITMDKLKRTKLIGLSARKNAKDIGLQTVPRVLDILHTTCLHTGGTSAAIGVAGLSMGGLGSAIAPWVTAAGIAWTYRHDVNRNDLHDVSPQVEHKRSPFPCNCQMNENARTECDQAIAWLINRNECDLAIRGISFMLAGLPSVAKSIYRGGRNLYRRLEFRSANGKAYPTPAASAKWEENGDTCFTCEKPISSALMTLKNPSQSRHHCRLCGNNFCTDCCSTRIAIMDPLEKGGNRKGLEEGCLVCATCIANAKTNQQELSSFASAPQRRANILKKNALPLTISKPGCKRAQAAIYCIFNGDYERTMFALVARDGAEDIVREAGM